MSNKLSNYTSLTLLSLLYLTFAYHYRLTPKYLVLATLVFSLIYCGWGLSHHLRSRSLRLRLVLEYLLVALLGIVLVATLLA